jgi:hypothetical protein
MDCDCCGTTESTDEQRADEHDEQNSDASGWPRPDGGSAGTDDGTPRDAGVTEPSAVTDRQIPGAVGHSLGVLFGVDDPPRTFGEWVEDVRTAAADADWMPPRVRDLCHDADGKHLARTPSQTYRFTCVFDAFVLHVLIDEPVTIESTVPGGDEVTARVTADGVAADPESAVLSFGAAADPDVPEEWSPAAGYGQTCPYIHAFPTRAAYEAWDESTPEGVTTAFPLTEARALAVALVEGTSE